MEEKCTKPVEEIKWVDQWWCDETTVNIKHNKTMPQCHNVTKQNCVTKWEMDDQARVIKFLCTLHMQLTGVRTLAADISLSEDCRFTKSDFMNMKF